MNKRKKKDDVCSKVENPSTTTQNQAKTFYKSFEGPEGVPQ
jgi:hypothetical protein